MGIFSFKLPELGEGIHEGEIVKWHVKPGDTVEEDQTIVEVQNDKAVVEVPSPVNGKVKEIKVAEGTLSIVGDELITFEVEGGANASSPTPTSEPNATAEPQTVDDAKLTDKVTEPAKTTEVFIDKTLILATPSVRKLAREKGINITTIKGTGPKGRITKEDVLGGNQQTAEAAAAVAEAPTKTEPKETTKQAPVATTTITTQQGLVEERVPLKGIRKVIAEAMVRSKQTAPHVTLIDEVEVSKLVAFRQRMKPAAEKKQIKVTYLPFIVKAVIGALRAFPPLNASIDDDKGEIVYKKYYNIGIATDTDNGLMVPVIKEGDRQSIWNIAQQINELAHKARDGKLAPDDMKNGTFTITNIGSAGGQFFTPVINYPEVAILGIGRIAEKPVVKNGLVQAAPVLGLSLSFDHRLIDGATAQEFLNYLKALLEDPELLLMEV